MKKTVIAVAIATTVLAPSAVHASALAPIGATRLAVEKPGAHSAVPITKKAQAVRFINDVGVRAVWTQPVQDRALVYGVSEQIVAGTQYCSAAEVALVAKAFGPTAVVGKMTVTAPRVAGSAHTVELRRAWAVPCVAYVGRNWVAAG